MANRKALERVRDALLKLPDDVIYDQSDALLELGDDQSEGLCFACIAGVAIALLDYDADYVAAAEYVGCPQSPEEQRALFGRARELLGLTEAEGKALFRDVPTWISPRRAAGAIARLIKGKAPWPNVSHYRAPPQFGNATQAFSKA